jgi:hypothetical protein
VEKQKKTSCRQTKWISIKIQKFRIQKKFFHLVALKISQENSQAIAFLCLIDGAANCCQPRVFAIVKRPRSLARSDSELAHGKKKKKKKKNRLGRAKVKY